MGGTKRKFQRPRYTSKAKLFGSSDAEGEEEETKTPPKKEDMKELLGLWQQSAKNAGIEEIEPDKADKSLQDQGKKPEEKKKKKSEEEKEEGN